MMEQVYLPVIEKRRGIVVANVGNIAVCDFPVKTGNGPEVARIDTYYIDRRDPMLEVSGRECVFGVVALELQNLGNNNEETATGLPKTSEGAIIN